MIAKESSIIKLIEGEDKTFFIPVYQRRYSWEKQNCKKLIDDLLNLSKNGKSTHFFGSVVYYARNLAGVEQYSIIDGQQRLTTITLLLYAIFNYISKHENENYDENGELLIPLKKFTDSYFYIDPYRRDNKLKLQLTEEDNTDFSNLMRKLPMNSNNKIQSNYSYLLEEISKKSFSDIKSIYESVKKLSIVNVSLDHSDDPQLIFESLNSTGMALKESDKIRNFLFMNVSHEEQMEFYNDYWIHIEKNVYDVSKLIKCYLTIKMETFINEKNLYYSFKEYALTTSVYHPKLVLKELFKYSEYMKDILSFTKYSKEEYQKCISRLVYLDMSTIYPLLFICFDEYKVENILTLDFNEMLKILESYIVRRIFMGLSASPLNKIFAFMPSEISKYRNDGATFKDALIKSLLSKTQNSRFPGDNEFADAFQTFELFNAKSSFRKYVFEMLENYTTKEIVDIHELINNNTLTIEHIMPQTLTVEWERELGDNFAIIHEKYKNRIGNLTLTGYNSEYGNSSFYNKLNLDEKGFKFSKLYLNEHVKKQTNWSEEQIIERGKLLLQRAFEIWSIPNYIKVQNEFNLFDSSTWTNFAITYLAKNAFKYMLENNLITDEERNLFLDANESRILFRASYPIFAENRTDHSKGKIHYSTDVYFINENKIHLSFEWFESQRTLLENFIKNKLCIN